MKKNQSKDIVDQNLLILNEEPCFFDGKNYYSRFNWGQFATALSPYFGNLFYVVPVARQKTENEKGIMIQGENVEIISLPFFDSMADFIRILPREYFKIKKIIKESVRKSDIIFLRLPSLSAFYFFFYAKRLKKPIITYIAGNILRAPGPINSGSSMAKIAASIVSYGIHIFTKVLVNNSIVAFVKGSELLRLYQNKKNRVILFITSLIKANQIFDGRNDTCQDQPIKILTVSRIIPTKGIEYLIESIYYLKKEGYDIELNIVGKEDSKAYINKLKGLADESDLGSRVIFHGYVPFGESLFQYYKEADICVISSLSEGSPRTILEAWSFGLPLVATKTGGIPDVVINEVNGLLISPKSSKEIYIAIKRIIEDMDLRRKLTRNGLEFAKNHTQEQQVIYTVDTIKEYLAYHGEIH